MRDPKPVDGGRALLFERLVDKAPRSQEEESQPFRVLDVRALKESVRHELERLLNTRCAVPAHRLGGDERTVLNYGIPDFSWMSAASANDQARLGSLIADTVSAFEPRLKQVRVAIERQKANDRAMRITIDAQLEVGTITEPVSFPVLVREETGRTEVNESEPE